VEVVVVGAALLLAEAIYVALQFLCWMPLVFLVCFVLFGCALLFAVFEPPFLGSRSCSSCGQRDLGLGWYAGSQLAGLLANLAASLGWLAAVCSSLWIERVANAVYFFQAFHLFKLPLGFFVHVLCLLVLLGVAGRVLLAAAWVLLADYAASSVFVDELACVTGSSAADKLGSCF
jgi:hypothetical protein